MKTDVLILGGGLAGLSTAYHIARLGGKLSTLVVEKKSTPGGLAGSVVQDGFTFDYTGHLLHLHDPYGKKFVMDLLAGNVASHDRSSWIHSHGAYTRYPFQANTCGLPDRVVEDCVAGFLKTVHRERPAAAGLPFKEWSLRNFGEGISKHFMIPYNEKLWRRDLSKMTTEWQGRFVPKPRPEEVLYGALFDQKKFFGYNASFRYPKRGGIQVLPDALAARVGGLRLNCEATSIDLASKTAVVTGIGEVRYERLVNTLPLASFLDLARPLPANVQAARRKLRWISVYNLNVGVGRAGVSDKHWVYFPEKRFPFYRAGFMSNFSKSSAPPGTSSLYIEVSRRPEERVDLPALERGIIDGLRNSGLIRRSDKIVSKVWLPIPCAYVIYDFNRTPAVDEIFGWFRGRGIESIGRYGGWKYSFMEETLLDGKRCAERLLGRREHSAGDMHRELKPIK